MFASHLTVRVRKKMLGSRIRRLKVGEDRKKKAATVKKYDLEKSCLADEMSSDDDSIVAIPEKTRSKAKSSGYKGKGPVRWSSQQEKKKYDLEKSDLADKLNSDDDSMVSIASRTRSKSKAPVKRTIFSRDPRLGAAQRTLEEHTVNTPELDQDSDVKFNPDNIFYDGAGPGIDLLQELEFLNKYFRSESYIKSSEAWNAKYHAQLKDHKKNEKEILGERDYTLALQAVKFYNHKHSTNYVLEETLGSYIGEFDDGFWAHCNFRAQNTGRRPVSRLFFAELFGDLFEYEVDSCVTLDGPGRCRDIVRGCEMCPKWVRHPVNEFKNGHPDKYPAV